MSFKRYIIIGIWFVLAISSTHSKNCTSLLQQAQQLLEQQNYPACIAALQNTSCQSYQYHNLIMNAYMGAEDYAKLRTYAAQCIQQYTSDAKITALAYYYQALALHKQDLNDQAHAQIQLSLQLWQDKSSAEYAMTCNAMGNIQESLGKHSEAIDTYKQALKIYNSLPNEHQAQEGQIITLSNLANAYLSTQLETALGFYKKLASIYKKNPSLHKDRYLAITNNFGEYYNQKGEYEQAAHYYQYVVSSMRTQNETLKPTYATSLLNVITALYNAEKYTETTPYISEYLQMLRAMLQRNFTIMTEQEREKFWNAQAQILDNLLVSATYASLSNRNADASLIYDICLLSKSLLLDTSTSIESIIASSNDATLIQLRKELIAAQQQNAPNCDLLEQRMIQRLQQLHVNLPQLHITWQNIQQQLNKNSLAVEFVCLGTGKNTEYAVVLLRQHWKYPKVYYINGLAETLDARQISRLDMHNNSIFGKLVWQHVLAEANPNDTIYFVPAGELHLMGLEYFTINQDVKMYERYNMRRLSSTKQLLLPQTNQPFQSVALLGGMNYNASIDEIEYYANEYQQTVPAYAQTQPTLQQSKIWSALPGSLREVQEINNVLSARGIKTFLATHDAATETAMYAIAAQQYDILHIATHGFYAQQTDLTMQESGLVMAGANTLQLQPNAALGTGILTAAAIAKLNLQNTRLAVLSACQTGVGEISTEGVFGTQRAFKLAGVKSLIVSLWKVNDAVTSALMTTFYKAIMAGYSYYDAFIIASDTIRQSTFQLNGQEISGDDISLYGAFVLID